MASSSVSNGDAICIISQSDKPSLSISSAFYPIKTIYALSICRSNNDFFL